MKKKIHLKFYPNPTRLNSKGEYPVYLRITVDRIKSEVAVGVSCITDLWDAETERIKSKPALNKVINDVDAKITAIIKRLEVEDKNITASLLKDLLQDNQTSKKTLLAYSNYFFKKYIASNVELAEGSKRIYKTSYETYLPNFLEHKFKQKRTDKEDNISKITIKNLDGKADILLMNCDLQFVNDYGYWMINDAKKDRNTAANHHKKLSILFKQAIIEKEIKENPYFGYKVKKKKTYIHKLEREQLDILETHDLAGNSSLQEVRDCFLFSVYTGFRIGDAFELKKNQIITKNDKKFWIVTTQEKTKEPLERPLLDKAKQIVDKYKEVQDITGFILPRRAHSKTNSYLKTIADLTGIDVGEPLHFHHARHTFATLICIENDIPLEATMKFLGHTDIRSTMVYADIRKQMLEKYATQINKSNEKNDLKRNNKK